MSRLIDADALLEGRQDHEMISTHLIWNAPTIEAEPVRHGEWVGESDGYADGYPVYDIWSCSCCGIYFDEWDEKPTWKYCPNCGAKMDGGEA